MTLKAVIMLAFAAAFGCRAACAITFSDGAFNDSEWTFYVEATGAGSSKAYQASPDGNPGSYRKILNTSVSDEIIAFSYLINAKWNPGSLGPIISIDCSFDHVDLLVGEWGQGAGLALRQNAKNYYGPSNLDYPSSWRRASWTGLTSADFRTMASASDHPDFSMAGSQAMIGFFNSDSNMGITRTTGSGYDNFQATLNIGAVPEPSSLAMLTCAIGATAGTMRRTRRKGAGQPLVGK